MPNAPEPIITHREDNGGGIDITAQCPRCGTAVSIGTEAPPRGRRDPFSPDEDDALDGLIEGVYDLYYEEHECDQ